jgi:hypothetical protein
VGNCFPQSEHHQESMSAGCVFSLPQCGHGDPMKSILGRCRLPRTVLVASFHSTTASVAIAECAPRLARKLLPCGRLHPYPTCRTAHDCLGATEHGQRGLVLAICGSLASAPDWPCLCVREGISPPTFELRGGGSEVARASPPTLLARRSAIRGRVRVPSRSPGSEVRIRCRRAWKFSKARQRSDIWEHVDLKEGAGAALTRLLVVVGGSWRDHQGQWCWRGI